jgi:hypothetical protein
MISGGVFYGWRKEEEYFKTGDWRVEWTGDVSIVERRGHHLYID